MPRRPAPLPASLTSPVFTAAEARRLGVTIDRLRAGDLVRLGYGLYARKDAELTERAVLGALLREDHQIVVSGRSAARLWKMPLPLEMERWEATPQMSVMDMSLQGRVRRNRPYLRWTRRPLRGEDIVDVDGLRITSRVRTWLDLTVHLHRDQLVIIADHLVRHPRPWAEGRNTPYATPDILAAAIEAHPGRGRPLLREALSLARIGSDSPAETRLRLAAARAGLPGPVLNRRQFEGRADLGEPDLAWPDWKVCLEHDGRDHRTKAQQEKDIARRERREQHGWIEVQTVANDLTDGCRRGIERLTAVLRRRGWEPGRFATGPRLGEFSRPAGTPILGVSTDVSSRSSASQEGPRP